MKPIRSNHTTLFISHASEDKDKVVRPLVHTLKKRGLQVWYDEFSLRLGDSLRRSIDRGLAECTAGVVVLSPSFFAKEWPQRELDALYTAEIAGRSRILPVWHELESADIARLSPLLADRRAALSKNGVDQVSREIAAEFPASAVFSGEELAAVLQRFTNSGHFATEALAAGCRHRFLLLNALKEDYCEIADKATEQLTECELEDFPAELDRRLAEEHDRLRQKYGIPENCYLVPDEQIREGQVASFLEAIDDWARGELSLKDSAELAADLDREELDEYFVLLGIPNFSFSLEQRHLIERALTALGGSVSDGHEAVARLCQDLRKLDGGS